MNPADPRAERSRQRLIHSLVTLALELGYGNFTIKDLTEHAVVGYATFFRHFKSLDELLSHILLGVFQDLTQRPVELGALFDQAVALYRFVSQHPQIYRLYFSLPTQHPIRALIDQKTTQLISDLANQRDLGLVPRTPAKAYLIKCANLLIVSYLDRLDKYAPEQIATMYFDLIIKGKRLELLITNDTVHE